MGKIVQYLGLLFVLVLICAKNTSARPYATFRVKRVSDQRLAELETLVALSKMSGKLVTVPLGHGKLDPKMIGRKRRAQAQLLENLFNMSAERDGYSAEPPEETNYIDGLLYRR